jgi:hypothetical protein
MIVPLSQGILRLMPGKIRQTHSIIIHYSGRLQRLGQMKR